MPLQRRLRDPGVDAVVPFVGAVILHVSGTERFGPFSRFYF